MKVVILYTSIAIASGLLFVNIYTSLIDARSWGSKIPQSMETARSYYKFVNPGNFFRIFSPASQVMALIALVAYWKSPSNTRLLLATAFILYVASDIFTFAYFYPRNSIMFKTAELTEVKKLTSAWSQWSAMNWLRSGLVFAGLLFSMLSLHRIYISTS